MRAFFVFVLVAVVVALATVYVAQYGFRMEPCVLCIYQRVPYWAAGAIALTALTVPTADRPGVANLLGVLFLCGAALAFYHTGVEQHWWNAATSCAAGEAAPNMPMSFEAFSATPLKPLVKSCDDLDWTIFGLSITVYNTAVQIALALIAFGAAARRRRTA
jgi:disulfide bond formation protein DsbB